MLDVPIVRVEAPDGPSLPRFIGEADAAPPSKAWSAAFGSDMFPDDADALVCSLFSDEGPHGLDVIFVRGRRRGAAD